MSWALQNNMSVIPRSSKRHHIEELARLLEDPKFLDAEDLKAIDSMSEAIKDPKHPFRKTDSQPRKSQKNRYERRKIKEFLHLGDWSQEEMA